MTQQQQRPTNFFGAGFMATLGVVAALLVVGLGIALFDRAAAEAEKAAARAEEQRVRKAQAEMFRQLQNQTAVAMERQRGEFAAREREVQQRIAPLPPTRITKPAGPVFRRGPHRVAQIVAGESVGINMGPVVIEVQDVVIDRPYVRAGDGGWIQMEEPALLVHLRITATDATIAYRAWSSADDRGLMAAAPVKLMRQSGEPLVRVVVPGRLLRGQSESGTISPGQSTHDVVAFAVPKASERLHLVLPGWGIGSLSSDAEFDLIAPAQAVADASPQPEIPIPGVGAGGTGPQPEPSPMPSVPPKAEPVAQAPANPPAEASPATAPATPELTAASLRAALSADPAGATVKALAEQFGASEARVRFQLEREPQAERVLVDGTVRYRMKAEPVAP